MTCTFEGCERPHFARGFCNSHYQQHKLGRPLTPLPPFKPRWRVTGDLADRLAAKSTRDESGCLLWTGSLKPNGYGKFVYQGKNLHAHRAAYELSVGPIPDGMVIDHLCGVRNCLEPSHMEVVTQGENTRRGATKTHCKRGHPLVGENLRWSAVRTGPQAGQRRRHCRACDAMHRLDRSQSSGVSP